MKNNPSPAVLFVASISFLAASGLLAGPLTPPPGAVGSTGKTITEAEPRIAINAVNTPGDADSLFKITQPGSYYLTGNITGVSGKHGIEISTSGVTIDLSGFVLTGVTGGLDGIITTGTTISCISVVNGSVRRWPGDGVNLGNGGPTACRVEGVNAEGNSEGIVVSEGVVSRCTASGNAATGMRGLNGVVFDACAARGNGGNGITASNYGTVRGCSASGNTGAGVLATTGAIIESTTAGGNTGNGITSGSGAIVRSCSAYENGGDGITAGNGTRIETCTVRRSGVHGINVAAESTVHANSSTDNGTASAEGAGVRTTGNFNNVTDNHTTGNDIGFWIEGQFNVLSGSRAFVNSPLNWRISDGNFHANIQWPTPSSVLVEGLGVIENGRMGTDNPITNIGR